ncbi:MAG: hypothetical protein HUJ75_01385 [Parasporobacterium sp.]|nr:hypothetical protein [Parasporobacterium sp.]
MEYELIREIFNKCSGNQMRDVFISDVETDDPEAYIRDLLKGQDVKISRTENTGGSIVFDVDIAGLMQRFTFTP